MKIRRATQADLPSITRIYNEGIATRMATADSEPRTLEERTEWFRQFDDRFPIWVGLGEDGSVVCYGNLHRWNPREGYRFTAENSVYVAESARGLGLGRVMLEHVVAEARRIGLHYLMARIFSNNAASVRLHERCGFKVLAVQREVIHLDGVWRDVTLMDCHLK
jgi:L-amino acid N-acyltransferase YncA